MALTNDVVKIEIIFQKASKLFSGTGTGSPGLTMNSTKLYVDYIYLDNKERQIFAEKDHEYLIEQVQRNKKAVGTAQLDFKFPVKELIWVMKKSSFSSGTVHDGNCCFFAASGNDGTYELAIDGIKRFHSQNHRQFTRYQVWKHHSGYGATKATEKDSIAVYSFGIYPEKLQPSGTCNFSRLNNGLLEFKDITAQADVDELRIYATNYNILRISNGIGQVGYNE
jgi:hypothetical protein